MNRLSLAWYRVLDFMQTSEFGKAVLWLAPRALRVVWLMVKLSFVVTAATFIIVYGMLFVVLMSFTGNGGAAMKSVTKLTLGVLAFFTVKQLASDGKLAGKVGGLLKSIGK